MDLIAVKSIRLLLMTGFWVSLPHLSLCQSGTVRQQIQASLQKADMSFRSQDVSGCLAMLTADFQGTDIRGTRFNKSQTRLSLIKEFAPHPFTERSYTIKSQVLKVTSTGPQASVIYHEHLAITIEGRTTHERHVLTLDTDRQSTWTQEKDCWRERSERQLTSRITRDGILKGVKDKK